MPRKPAKPPTDPVVDALKADVEALKNASSTWKTDSVGWRLNHEVKLKELELQMKSGFETIKSDYATGQSEQNKKLDALVLAETDRKAANEARDKLLASMERWIKFIGGSTAFIGSVYGAWEVLHRVLH